MKNTRILVSLFVLLGIFPFANANAMERTNQQNLVNPVGVVDTNEKKKKDNLPIEVGEDKKTLIFNLFEGKDKEYVTAKKKVENIIKSSNLNIKNLYDVKDVLITFLRERINHYFHNFVIKSPDDPNYMDVCCNYDLCLLFLKSDFKLAYDGRCNFREDNNKENNNVMVIFDGDSMTNLHKIILKNLEHPEKVVVLKEILALFHVVMEQFFYHKPIASFDQNEYVFNLNLPVRQAYVNLVRPKIIEFIEKKGIRFNGDKEDFDAYYDMAYERLSESKYGKICLFKGFEADLYDPANIEYIKLSEDGLTATFKFKHNDSLRETKVRNLIEYLLDFENKIVDDHSACVIREVIAFYVERMKENKSLKEIGNKKEKNILDLRLEYYDKLNDNKNKGKKVTNEKEYEDEKEIKTDSEKNKPEKGCKIFEKNEKKMDGEGNKNLKEIGNKKEKNIREDEKEIKTDSDNDKNKKEK